MCIRDRNRQTEEERLEAEIAISIRKQEERDNRPHYVYRYFDAQDRLLYVGVTINLKQRDAAHRHNSAWRVDAVRREVEEYPNRETAYKCEAIAIREESPLHNRQGLPPRAQLASAGS